MKGLILLALVAVVFCQVPPSPPPPKVSCKTAIAKYCPNQTGFTCLRCAYQNRQKIEAVSDCTRQDIQQACGQSPPNPTKCKAALNKVCAGDSGKGTTCFTCTRKNTATLNSNGCTNQLISQFCRGGSTTNKCPQAIAKYCPKMQHQGKACVACTTKNQAALRNAGCTTFKEEQYCQAGPVPNPPGAAGCSKAMSSICPTEKGKGAACYKCLFGHYSNVTHAGCTGKDLHNYCGTGHQTGGCQKALSKYCGPYAGQHYYCFQCVVSNTDDLKAAGCTVDNYDKFCEKRIGNNCTATLKKLCGADYRKGKVCSQCVQKNKPSVVSAGCQQRDINSFCRNVRPPPPAVPTRGGRPELTEDDFVALEQELVMQQE